MRNFGGPNMRKLLEWLLVILLYPVFCIAKYLNQKQAEERPFCLVHLSQMGKLYYFIYVILYKTNYYQLDIWADNPFIDGRNIIDNLERQGLFEKTTTPQIIRTSFGAMSLIKCREEIISVLYGKNPDTWQKNLKQLIELKIKYEHEYADNHKNKENN